MALALTNGSLLMVQNSRSDSRQRLSPVSVRISMTAEGSEFAISLEKPSPPPYVRLPDPLRKTSSAPAGLMGARRAAGTNSAGLPSSSADGDLGSMLAAAFSEQFGAWMHCCSCSAARPKGVEGILGVPVRSDHPPARDAAPALELLSTAAATDAAANEPEGDEGQQQSIGDEEARLKKAHSSPASMASLLPSNGAPAAGDALLH